LAGTGGVRAEVTDAEGRWRQVAEAEGDFDLAADITDLLSSRYECHVRLILPADGLLRRVRFEGELMVAPLSLPRLAAGENPMQVRCGDRHGLDTVPWSEIVDFRDSGDVLGRCESATGAAVADYVDGFVQVAPAGDGPATLTFRFDAPAGEAFAWAYVHATVREGPPDQPQRTAALEVRADDGPWRAAGRIDVDNTPRQWDCSVDGEAVFERPAGAVRVRVTSETPITGVEFHGHLAGRPRPGQQVLIRHRWLEGGEERTFEPPPDRCEYVILCGEDPAGHTIEMWSPSVPRGGSPP
jgi:hypothetical protein